MKVFASLLASLAAVAFLVHVLFAVSRGLRMAVQLLAGV